MRLVFIVGPTAIGKSETAVILAKKINAEIISCDSMQVYRRINILTAKATAAARRGVRHHLIDIVPAQREYNVARFCREAAKKIKEINKRGRPIVLAGGTGLYVHSLIDGIFQVKSENKALREKFYRQADKYGNGYLQAKLKKVDPLAAAKIHPHDTRRIIRALEVFYTAGKPISVLQKEKKGLKDKYELAIFGLDIERDQLYQRIDARVDRMFARGLVKEVQKILKLKLSKTAAAALGIKELKGFFSGLYDLAEAKRLIKRNTRRYAKRQLAWFRRDRRIKWIKLEEKEKPRDIAARIWKELY